MDEIEEKELDLETTVAALPSGEDKLSSKKWIFIAIGLLLLALFITGVVLLLRADPAVTSQVRDLFIIAMALEFFVIGVALIVLIVQVAVLTNVLQNEVKPILNSTQDTVNTLKGTVKFLSNNVSEPVIRMNEYLAGFKKLLEIFKLVK